MAIIRRFSSSLNEHGDFHCCVIDEAFEPTAAPDYAPSINFPGALDLDPAAFANLQARVRTPVPHAFVRRDLMDKDDIDEMGGRKYGGGFQVDAWMDLEGGNPPELERLLCECARPPFAVENLPQRDAEYLVNRDPKPRPDGPGNWCRRSWS